MKAPVGSVATIDEFGEQPREDGADVCRSHGNERSYRAVDTAQPLAAAGPRPHVLDGSACRACAYAYVSCLHASGLVLPSRPACSLLRFSPGLVSGRCSSCSCWRRPLLPSSAQSLLVCGWDEVFVLDVSAAPRKVWSWKAMAPAGAAALPYRTKFRTTDDCKTGDRRATAVCLITASSDGARDWSTRHRPGRTVWWAECGNTHSRRVAAAATPHRPGLQRPGRSAGQVGWRLVRSAREPGHGARSFVNGRSRTFDGHGRGGTGCLALAAVALGEKELRAYRLKDWRVTPRPGSRSMRATRYPTSADTSSARVPDSPDLMVSTHAGVWRFAPAQCPTPCDVATADLLGAAARRS